MENWLRRGSRVLLMGLAWAAAWVPVGALAGGLIVGELEPEHIGGPLYAGFLCGAAYSVVAGIAAGRRALAGMSFSLAGVRGMLSGLLVGGLFVVVALLSDPPRWLLYVAVVGSLAVLSAVSGVGSAMLARVLKNGARANAA